MISNQALAYSYRKASLEKPKTTIIEGNRRPCIVRMNSNQAVAYNYRKSSLEKPNRTIIEGDRRPCIQGNITTYLATISGL